MSDFKKAVFISYASEDGEAAKRIGDALSAAGIEVWFDQSALKSGDAWDQMIRQQIRDCALLIPIISAHTNERTEGYFRREWKLAVDRTNDMADDATFLLPVVIDDSSEGTSRVPPKFREMHWTRLPRGEVSPVFVNRVRMLLAQPQPTTPADALEQLTSNTAERKISSNTIGSPSRRRWILLPVLVLALGYGAFRASNSIHHSVEGAPMAPAADYKAAREKSIAVMPFVDLSPQKDQEYFAEGMAEEILNLLASIPNIRVLSRSSSFQFRGRNEDLGAIGEKLNVAYAVEGTVLKVGTRIRVTSQLIETRTGIHLWGDSQDRDYADVLTIQQQIATGVARALQLEVAANDERIAKHLESTEAYTEYLKGLHELDSFHQNSLFAAQASFEHALALDPTFLHAAEALAHAHVTLALDESMSPLLSWREARKAAEAALKLDPDSPSAHAVLGIVYGFNDFNWSDAEKEIAIALALKPRDSVTLNYAA